ncbi:MAG TPA: hypothetical protein VMA95_22470, partial [Streptosporangiaceae bacterium]|nr:hypothetical protein [Streptosporangiaceae bacterium]
MSKVAVDQARTVMLSGPASLRGALSVPGDKSISHRVLLLAAIAQGITHVTGLSLGDDVRRTRLGIEQFGADVEEFGPGALAVTGGLRHEPAAPIDLGNSGTAMRLLAGVCAGQDAFSVLTGDRYLLARPMDRV